MSFQLDASAGILAQEAAKRGFSVETFDNRNLLRVTIGKKQFFICGSRTSLQSSVGMTIADKKHLARKVLGQAGLPIANGGLITGNRNLSHFASMLHFPVVIKPVDGQHGQGVVVGIRTLEELLQVYHHSGYKRMIVEEMAVGKDFRVAVVDYHFVAATYRVPAHVVGDGQKSIEALIELKNADPQRGDGHTKPLTKITVDDLVTNYLSEQGFKLTSVPAANETVLLRKTANLSTGGEGWDVTDSVCAENKAVFEQVARVADLNTVGIDIIAPTLETPLAENGGAIIEINASPGLRMHHFPAKGQVRDVAGAIITMLENAALTAH